MHQHHPVYCPRCRIPLIVGSAHGRQVHGCTHCAGVWLDLELGARLARALDHELDGLLKSLGANARGHADTAQTIGCPRCQAPLERYLASSQRIELDHCAQHGTWFDRDEAMRLAQALASDRAYQAYNQGAMPRSMGVGTGMSTGAKLGLAAGGVAAAGAAAYAAHEMMQERQRPHALDAEVAVDVAETGVELASEGALESGVELAGDVAEAGIEVVGAAAEVGGAAVGGVFELLGGIFDAFG